MITIMKTSKLGRHKTVNKAGNVHLYLPDNPMACANGYIAEHRFIKSVEDGVILDSDNIVHHIDLDHNNNDPTNLQIVTRAEHARIHARLRWPDGRALYDYHCLNCGKLFVRPAPTKSCPNKYCSNACKYAHMVYLHLYAYKDYICVKCGKPFIRRGYKSTPKYCSIYCYRNRSN